jgi:membrane-bound hydrogenase subunit beta
MTEESIKNDLAAKFGFLADTIRIQRKRRIWADADPDNFRKVFDYAVKDIGFSILCAVTGLDEGARFGFIYHIAKPDGTILNLKTWVSKEMASIKTITDAFPEADIYEREIADLLGIKIEGLPPGRRYPLPDDWPAGEYPLRKDWKRSD